MCATCEYWTGNRRPVFDHNGKAKIDIWDEEGQCECPNGSMEGFTRRKDLKCKYFSKWTEIL